MKNLKVIFFAIFITTSFISCQNSMSGNYIVYGIHNVTNAKGYIYNQKISDMLEAKVSGKRFHIEQKKEFLILKDLSNNTEQTFSKGEDREQKVYYANRIKKGDLVIEKEIWPNHDNSEKNLFLVIATIPSSNNKIQNLPISGSEDSQMKLSFAVIGINTNFQFGAIGCYFGKDE